jgi:hypothetical protein
MVAAMKSGAIPFQFDITDALTRLRNLAGKRLGNVTLSLPFVSISVNPNDREKQVAREIVIRLRDRRVLSAWECCDDCIEKALASLQEIREFLVNKRVELSDLHDGPLFVLADTMIVGIRQFLAFEQRLQATMRPAKRARGTDARQHPEIQQGYFDDLEILRGHLSSAGALVKSPPSPEGKRPLMGSLPTTRAAGRSRLIEPWTQTSVLTRGGNLPP